ncbi:hypothetical protein KQI63_10345 [bacterium]|nr:hypothetical protein [bacterium]
MNLKGRRMLSTQPSPRMMGMVALLMALLLAGCTASSQMDTTTEKADSSTPVVEQPPASADAPIKVTKEEAFQAAVDSVRASDSTLAADPYFRTAQPSETGTLDPKLKAAMDSLRSADSTVAGGPYFGGGRKEAPKRPDTEVSGQDSTRPTLASPFGSLEDQQTLLLSDSTSSSTDSTGAIADSLKAVPEEEESDLDTSIVYSGDDIRFDVVNHSSIIRGNAKLIYKDMTLTANEIVIDWNNNLMTARPAWDTLYTDSTNTEIDTIKAIGMPSFKQGGQNMFGTMMRVNMKTKEGYVEGGRTEYGDGYYLGDQIQKVSDEVLYVHDGAFTSCDLEEHQHYKFTGSQMKMIYKERVVGKPIVLRFGDVPVFALPFGVFSIKPGRHSGVLIPTYGDDARRGRHLRNLGYYYAESDNWDVQSTLDFYEKAGILLKSSLVYKKRYAYSGGVSGSYSDQTTSGNRSTSWDTKIRHNQDIDQYTRLRVNATFISGKNHTDEYYDDPTRRLKQDIRSNATLTKSFPSNGGSMSLNLSHTQNLVTKVNSQTLPSFSYRMGSKNLFPSEQKKKSTDKSLLYEPPTPREKPSSGSTERDRDTDKWYNSITYNYSNRFENKRDETRPGNSSDLTIPLEETYQSGLTHSVSVNAPQKLFKYFNLTPSISYREDWFNERRDYYFATDSTLSSVQERGFFQRRTFSSSLTANTKLYGFFGINRGTVQAVRHVMTPSLSFRFAPDFSDPAWGYYEKLSNSVTDTAGVTRTYSEEGDRYRGSIFGSTSARKQLTLGMNLNNLFQMKRVKLGEDGEEEELKNDLFTYNLSTNYNFAADSMRFGRLSGSFRADPITGKNSIGPLDRVNIQVSTTHSFYQYLQEKDENGRKIGEVDRFYWDQTGHGLNVVRLTSFETSSSFSLSGKSPFVRERKEAPPPDLEEDDADSLLSDEDRELNEIRNDLDDRFKDPIDRVARTSSGKPWRIGGSIRYNLSMNDPIEPQETIRLQGNFTVQLTPNWQFQYSTSLDLQNREVVGSNLIIKRDLHCWEGSLRWSPQGIGQGFFLRIGIKSPTLRDVKIEQQRGRGSLGF